MVVNVLFINVDISGFWGVEDIVFFGVFGDRSVEVLGLTVFVVDVDGL